LNQKKKKNAKKERREEKKATHNLLVFADPDTQLSKVLCLIVLQVFLSPRHHCTIGDHCFLVLRITVFSVIGQEADLWFQETVNTCSLAEK
jgi:hypothetical protein